MMRKHKLRRVAMARKVTPQSIIASNWRPIWNRWSSSRGLCHSWATCNIYYLFRRMYLVAVIIDIANWQFLTCSFVLGKPEIVLIYRTMKTECSKIRCSKVRYIILFCADCRNSLWSHSCIGQFVVGFSAATETHPVPAVIPRHYPVTFLNCNAHSGPNSGIAT